MVFESSRALQSNEFLRQDSQTTGLASAHRRTGCFHDGRTSVGSLRSPARHARCAPLDRHHATQLDYKNFGRLVSVNTSQSEIIFQA